MFELHKSKLCPHHSISEQNMCKCVYNFKDVVSSIFKLLLAIDAQTRTWMYTAEALSATAYLG